MTPSTPQPSIYFCAKEYEPVDDYDEPTYENVGFLASTA